MERSAAEHGEKDKPGRRIEQIESTPVVLSTSMGRLSPNVLESWWIRDREMCGLDDWTFHELRHSYLSTLALKGVHPKIMQELACHASSSITMEIYTQVNMDVKRQAANVVEDLFPEPEQEATQTIETTPRVIPGGRAFTIVGSDTGNYLATRKTPRAKPWHDSYQAANQ